MFDHYVAEHFVYVERGYYLKNIEEKDKENH
jgi:hypothetical protein